MSILDSMPHRCTIRRRVRAKGTLGGSKDSFTGEQTNVHCWQQNASHREIAEFQKQNIEVSHRVYFTSDPSVDERHQILITEMGGVAVAAPLELDVKSEALPDASAGTGTVWKVMTLRVAGRQN